MVSPAEQFAQPLAEQESPNFQVIEGGKAEEDKRIAQELAQSGQELEDIQRRAEDKEAAEKAAEESRLADELAQSAQELNELQTKELREQVSVSEERLKQMMEKLSKTQSEHGEVRSEWASLGEGNQFGVPTLEYFKQHSSTEDAAMQKYIGALNDKYNEMALREKILSDTPIELTEQDIETVRKPEEFEDITDQLEDLEIKDEKEETELTEDDIETVRKPDEYEDITDELEDLEIDDKATLRTPETAKLESAATLRKVEELPKTLRKSTDNIEQVTTLRKGELPRFESSTDEPPTLRKAA